MTNQLQGEVLFKGWNEGADQWVYTPWMPVRGDVGTFGVQVLRIQGLTLTWNVETRTAEDPASVDALFASDETLSSVTASAVTSDASVQEVKQLVRYRFATGSGASATDFVIFRALQPSWEQDR